jgi:CDP-4-dehydro-6-deoxyglucose reductase, E3
VSYRVQVLQSGRSFEVDAEESILAGALRANVSLAHDCQLGGCGTCRMKLVEGTVKYAEHPMALTPEEAAEGYALACQAIPTSDLVIHPSRAETEPSPPTRLNAVIQSVEPVSALVTHLRLEVPGANSLTYRPGQYMNVVLPNGTTRSFSMASKPCANRLDFHIRRIAGGSFTDLHLPSMEAGHKLEIEIPFGSFLFHAQDYRPLLMVATGTGWHPSRPCWNP